MSLTRSAVCALVVASQLAWVAVAVSQVVPLGNEFQANTYTSSSQFDPGVATDSSGNFTVGLVERPAVHGRR